MPRTYTTTERDRLADDFNLHSRLIVDDAAGVARDLTGYLGVDWVTSASGGESMDSPVSTATFTLTRTAQTPLFDWPSLSPLYGASAANDAGPLLWAARRVRYQTAIVAPGVTPGDSDFRTRFVGYLTDVDAASADDTVTIQAASLDALLGWTIIRGPITYSDDAGTPLQQVIQQILDDNLGVGVAALAVVGAPNWMVRGFEQSAGVSVLDAVRALSLQIGWEVRYRFPDGGGDPVLTLYEPEREKVGADFTIPASEYLAITRQAISDRDVRNVVAVKFLDAATGLVITSVTEIPASIARYGERYMELAEAATSNIDSIAEAVAMSSAAALDLSDPYAETDVTTLDFWPVQLGDMVALGANGDLFDAPQVSAVQSYHWDHKDGHGETTMSVRGKPSASYTDWQDRAGTGPTDKPTGKALRLENFREKSRNRTGVLMVWDDGELPTRGKEIDVYAKTQPEGTDVDPWPADDAIPSARLTPDTREWRIPYPPLQSVTYVEFRPIDKTGATGDAEQVTVTSVGQPPRFGSLTQTPSSSGLSTTIALEIIDPQGFGGTLTAWLNHDDADHDANAATTPDGATDLLATPATIGGTVQFRQFSSVGTRPLFAGIAVHPGRGKRIFLEFVNEVGTSTGVQSFLLLSGGGIIDAAGNIVDAAINNARQFADGLTPPRVLTALPPDGTAAGFAPGELAVLYNSSNPTGKLYKWTGSAWVSAVSAPEMDGQVVASQIADAAITTAKFALGITPVKIIANRSAPGATGQVALDTATGALVRYVGGAWIDDVPTTALTGQIASTQLAVGSVTANSIAAGAITAGKIAANAVIAGTVAAGAISTTELAANAINASKIAANSILSFHILAGEITASKLAAGAVTAVSLAAGAVTASSIAANAITAASIAAGAVTATAIAAKAVKATHLEVSVLSDVKDAAGNTLGLGIIVSGRLTSIDGARFLDLNATGSSAFLFHPSFALYADGTAVYAGTVAAVAFTGALAAFANGITVNGTGGSGPFYGVGWNDPAAPSSRRAYLNSDPSGPLRIFGRYGLYLTSGGVGATPSIYIESGAIFGGTASFTQGVEFFSTAVFDGAVSFLSALTFGNNVRFNGSVGFFGASPIGRPTVSGSKGGNAALASLLAALGSSQLGLITDATS